MAGSARMQGAAQRFCVCGGVRVQETEEMEPFGGQKKPTIHRPRMGDGGRGVGWMWEQKIWTIMKQGFGSL
ncbi:hypothetical protein XENTR_v10022452 [Xenopus tropicalis]|nr:hypothetical protein XENTR_v10022452 [Xenopus tropicalis]